MSLLLRVLRAAHANSTHHKLALDALAHLDGGDAEAWRRLLLSQNARLLAGAKAPDDEFKDFANHVLHPRDGYWGGAPEKAVEWYDALVAALRASDWAEAAFAAGVLGHYLSDPLMPLHTAQSEAEASFHRAIEWSVSRSYDDLLATVPNGSTSRTAPSLGAGPRGLTEHLCHGADRANAHYETLLAHYDIAAGVVDPPSGLDPLARALLGDLLTAAAASIGAVLTRAVAEAAVAPPEVSLVKPTLAAVMAIPRKLLERRLVDAADRAAVAAMYDELRATGRVVETLGEDERAVAARYAAEVAAPRAAAQDAARRRRVAQTAAMAAVAGEPAVPAAETSAAPVPAVAPASLRERLERHAGGDPLARLTPRPAPPRPSAQQPPLVPLGKAAPAAREATPPPLPSRPGADTPAGTAHPAGTTHPAGTVASAQRTATATPRVHLAPTDDLEKAPSIGPKTAERLAVAGLRTVADLIAADPDVVAAQAGLARVDGDTVRDWQDEARLVMSIAGLRGSGAQLFVGAGYRSLDAIAAAEPDKLCADLLTFAGTAAGHRILRDGQPPDVEKVKAWADAARAAARAA